MHAVLLCCVLKGLACSECSFMSPYHTGSVETMLASRLPPYDVEEAGVWVQTNEESETTVGQLRDAEAATNDLQAQLKQLQDQRDAQASQAEEAAISQEDTDGALMPSPCFSAYTSYTLGPIL